MLYLKAFGGPVALGGGLVFTSHGPRCLRIFLITSSFDLEALDRLVLYNTNYLHLSGTFRASQWVYLPGSCPGQAPIL
jgi:hypothetical protein